MAGVIKHLTLHVPWPAREAWVTKVSVEEVLFRVPVAKRLLRSSVQEEGLEQVTSVVLTPVVVT